MTPVPADLIAFLAQQRDSREYRRGLAVKLAFEGFTYETISSILDCTPGFVSHMKHAYLRDGVAGLSLKYQGSRPLLTQAQRDAVITWLKEQQQWSPESVRQHSEQTFAVVLHSDQSYYDLLHAANITCKKVQARNPKRDPERVAAKKKR